MLKESMNDMTKQRFRLLKQGWGTYYIEDTTTGKQQSLKTSNKQEAERLLHAKCEAKQLPNLSAKIARIYWEDADPMAKKRTWQYVLDQMVESKKGENQRRWRTAAKDKAFNIIRDVLVIETLAEHFLDVLKNGTTATNVYLRRIHNFALDMNWLGRPVIASMAPSSSQGKEGYSRGRRWVRCWSRSCCYAFGCNVRPEPSRITGRSGGIYNWGRYCRCYRGHDCDLAIKGH